MSHARIRHNGPDRVAQIRFPLSVHLPSLRLRRLFLRNVNRHRFSRRLMTFDAVAVRLIHQRLIQLTFFGQDDVVYYDIS